MNKRLLPAVRAAVLLLAGCSQEPVPYDYDLSAYIELGTYSAIPYLPSEIPGGTRWSPMTW